MADLYKKEIIDEAAAQSGLTKGQVSKALEAILATVIKQVSEGHRVTFMGFGSFSTKEVSSRSFWNMSKGALDQTPAKVRPQFRCGKAFAEAVLAQQETE